MAANGTERNGNVAWQTKRAETSMRLGLAKLENPTDRDKMGEIILHSGLPEMSFFARTLVTNGSRYAVDSLGWSLDHVQRTGLQVNPELTRQVEARLRRAGQ